MNYKCVEVSCVGALIYADEILICECCGKTYHAGPPPVILASDTTIIFNKTQTYKNRTTKKNFIKIFSDLLLSTGGQTKKNLQHLDGLIRPECKVLIIGAGEIGNGLENFLTRHQCHGVDIYTSQNIDTVCDAHRLPFFDSEFDLVIIQAVLEHVIDPEKVISEIYRVLSDFGHVYAETPFMQPVHEGAYDFRRYTCMGHRLIFHSFDVIDFGPLGGVGLSCAWGIYYLFSALIPFRLLSKVLSAPFFLLGSAIDFLLPDRRRWISSPGAYFIGRKREKSNPFKSFNPGDFRGN